MVLVVNIIERADNVLQAARQAAVVAVTQKWPTQVPVDYRGVVHEKVVSAIRIHMFYVEI